MVSVWPACWMQTIGAALFAIKGCGQARARMSAQNSRGVPGLLYLAAVRLDGREREHCQDHVDAGLHHLTAMSRASSSRSQVAMGSASVAARLTCGQLSFSVCRCPSLALGAVTHFVTRPVDLGGGDPAHGSEGGRSPAVGSVQTVSRI